MKKLLLSGSLITLSLMSLGGCVSNNVKRFQPDITQAYQVTNAVSKKVMLGSFSMRAEKDKNNILCRLAGNIYLPNKMTYSRYIKHAFGSFLIAAHRYTIQTHKNTHKLSAHITDVNFNSFNGEWRISANMQVDNRPPVAIYVKSKFGTSFDAGSACKNVADSFETAVQDFITKTFNNPKIKAELNK